MFIKKCEVCSKEITLIEYYKVTWWNHQNFKCPNCNNMYKVTDKSKLVYSIILVIPIIYIWTSFKLRTLYGIGFTLLWFLVGTFIIQPIILSYEKYK
jgi:CXXC-20-CXXC protein